jgi:hypothetical protein
MPSIAAFSVHELDERPRVSVMVFLFTARLSRVSIRSKL